MKQRDHVSVYSKQIYNLTIQAQGLVDRAWGYIRQKKKTSKWKAPYHISCATENEKKEKGML